MMMMMTMTMKLIIRESGSLGELVQHLVGQEGSKVGRGPLGVKHYHHQHPHHPHNFHHLVCILWLQMLERKAKRGEGLPPPMLSRRSHLLLIIIIIVIVIIIIVIAIIIIIMTNIIMKIMRNAKMVTWRTTKIHLWWNHLNLLLCLWNKYQIVRNPLFEIRAQNRTWSQISATLWWKKKFMW